MAPTKPKARHVFHSSTSGPDRVQAWQESTGEPVFSWGRDSSHSDGAWFRSVKRDFSLWLEGTSEADLTVYHDGMGADAIGPLDPCPQKVLFLHNFLPRWERNFEWMLRCTGKLMVGSEALAGQIRDSFAWIPGKYIHTSLVPVLRDSLSGPEGTGSKNRTGIWLHGRPWKRFGNRLRSIVDRWPVESGELEIITSGKKIPGWAAKPHIRWSGNLPLEFALLRLHTWDSTLLLNDYSLDSPWLLRALELGCFPLVPEGASPARSGPWKEDSAPQPYAWGDVLSAARLLNDWRGQRDRLQPQFQQWAHGCSQPEAQFLSTWERVKEEVVAQRAPSLRERSPIGGAYPVRLYERVQRLRAGA